LPVAFRPVLINDVLSEDTGQGCPREPVSTDDEASSGSLGWKPGSTNQVMIGATGWNIQLIPEQDVMVHVVQGNRRLTIGLEKGWWLIRVVVLALLRPLDLRHSSRDSMRADSAFRIS